MNLRCKFSPDISMHCTDYSLSQAKMPLCQVELLISLLSQNSIRKREGSSLICLKICVKIVFGCLETFQKFSLIYSMYTCAQELIIENKNTTKYQTTTSLSYVIHALLSSARKRQSFFIIQLSFIFYFYFSPVLLEQVQLIIQQTSGFFSAQKKALQFSRKLKRRG
jgi:hypothetical protein